jgi:hypothetical protein
MLLSTEEDDYGDLVNIDQLESQILKVEGIQIELVQHMRNKRKILDKLRYPKYPYTTKFEGPIGDLIAKRITPILQQETIVED